MIPAGNRPSHIRSFPGVDDGLPTRVDADAPTPRHVKTPPNREAAACRTHSAICSSSYSPSWMSTQRASLSMPEPGGTGRSDAPLRNVTLMSSEDVHAHEPTLSLDAPPRRVPPHRLPHIRHAPHDERFEPPPDVALPPRHGRDVRLHRSVAVPPRNLRIAAREKHRRCDGIPCGHHLPLGRPVGHGVHSTTPLAKAKGCVQCVEIAEGPAARSVGSTRDAYGQGNNVPIAVLRHHSHQGSII